MELARFMFYLFKTFSRRVVPVRVPRLIILLPIFPSSHPPVRSPILAHSLDNRAGWVRARNASGKVGWVPTGFLRPLTESGSEEGEDEELEEQLFDLCTPLSPILYPLPSHPLIVRSSDAEEKSLRTELARLEQKLAETTRRLEQTVLRRSALAEELSKVKGATLPP